jgi:protein ImuB
VTGVGAPSLDDSHRPDAARVIPFTGSAVRTAAVAALTSTDALSLVCRRFVPPLPAVVRTRRVREEPGAMAGPGGAPEQRPARVAANGVRGDVVACAGPWRTTGEWWTDAPWAREEWDVALTDGAAYRLALDLGVRRWTVEAVYD